MSPAGEAASKVRNTEQDLAAKGGQFNREDNKNFSKPEKQILVGVGDGQTLL